MESARTAEKSKVIPPLNFAVVDKGIYRSGHPIPKNFAFVKQLGLKSVLYLSQEEYPKANKVFLERNGIQLFHLGTHGNKEPFQFIEQEIVRKALLILVDPENHPILVHCNKGTVRPSISISTSKH